MKQETRFRTAKVIPFLKSLKNTYHFPIQQVGIHGDPDYLLCCRGVFVALELKIDFKRPRKLQAFKLEQVERCGGISLVATPSTWQDVSNIILSIDRGTHGKKSGRTKDTGT